MLEKREMASEEVPHLVSLHPAESVCFALSTQVAVKKVKPRERNPYQAVGMCSWVCLETSHGRRAESLAIRKAKFPGSQATKQEEGH